MRKTEPGQAVEENRYSFNKHIYGALSLGPATALVGVVPGVKLTLIHKARVLLPKGAQEILDSETQLRIG